MQYGVIVLSALKSLRQQLDKMSVRVHPSNNSGVFALQSTRLSLPAANLAEKCTASKRRCQGKRDAAPVKAAFLHVTETFRGRPSVISCVYSSWFV